MKSKLNRGNVFYIGLAILFMVLPFPPQITSWMLVTRIIFSIALSGYG